MSKPSARASTLAENPSCNPVCRVCHYKNLDYPSQLRRKQEWAESQLYPWSDVLRDIRPAPEGERLAYRSKSWMRSSYQEGVLSFGMFRSLRVGGNWEKEFVSWDSCPLHAQSIQQMVERFRKVFSREVPEFIERSLVGIWVGSPHLVVVARDPDLETMKQLDWNEILVPPFDRVWFHHNPQVGRKVFGHRPIEAIVGPPEDGIHPIRAFRQNAQTLLTEARKQAMEALLGSRPRMLLDLYCGTGDLSLLMPEGIVWIGIELSQEAAEFAQLIRPPEPSLHAAFVGTVEHRLRDPRVLSLISEPYALYLNPPRSGLTEEARESIYTLIRDKKPTSLVYLSCSASSLARDLMGFEGEGYRVKLLQPYDFFPQTEHFETLAVLEADSRTRS